MPVQKLFLKFVCLFLIFTGNINLASAQSNSNAGTEFWATFPTHVPDFDKNFNISLANISIFITSTQASSGTITAGNFSQTFIVAPNSVTEIKVPRSSVYIDETESGTVLPNRAIHILVDDGKPKVVVYAHIFAGQRSAASLILPVESLGQQYYSMNYQEYDNEGKNFITLVASEPDTKIHIKRGNTELVPGGITLNNVNDVYEYLSTDDLSGVSVSVDMATSACKRFVMFSGSTAVYISNNGCTPKSIDPLYQQCYPVDSWGNTYGVIPFSTTSPNFTANVRTAGQYVRVVAKDDNTVININGTTVATLQAGQYYTTPTPLQSASYISATKPVTVAQYALSQSCSNTVAQSGSKPKNYSDPDMVILNPIAFNIKNITVYSSSKENITEQYINVLMKTAATASFKVNGQAPSAAFVPMNTLPDYSYLQLNLNGYSQKTFTLTADDGFNAIAYGFGDVESYAYSAGTNLAAKYTLNAIKTSTNQIIDTACTNDDFVFKLTLPYKAPQIVWKMDVTEAPIVQLNPTPAIITGDNKVEYVYSLPKTPAYQLPGNHIIKIDAYYPNNLGGCNTGAQVIDDSFFTISPPATAFTAMPEACVNVIDFKDISQDIGHQIVSRIWDFGDGSNNSTEINPIHQFADDNTYNVTLTTISSTGCQYSNSQPITITRKIVLDMTTSSPNCVGKTVYFTDASQTTDFTTATRKWYFGTGDSLLTDNNNPVPYVYKQSGVFNVKLVLVNAQGCSSDTLTRAITINPNPRVDFSLPPACVSDIVSFEAQSFSLTGEPYTYLWDFGDLNATADNPNNVAEQNPKHHYTEAQLYNVSLKVTSAAGCDTTITKQLLINGSEPKADFSIMNGDAICNNDIIVLKDKSRVVDFGVITKLEWHFNVAGQPTYKMAITSFTNDNIYTCQSPFTNVTSSTLCNITQLAYSGGMCVDSISKNIMLLPSPKVKFDKLSNVCINSSPLQFTQASELTGISGDGGIYSGDGVATNGLFNPVLAGLGKHVIKYKFTSAGGCTDSLTSEIAVLTEPSIETHNIYILQGQAVILQPKYHGDSLSFKWMPATGLSNDTIPYPTARPKDDITYTVKVSNGLCQNLETLSVFVLKPPIVNNTFTPNGDGINDTWEIANLNEYPQATVEIFNRYGQSIFYSVGYSKPWNGKYHGADMPVGTYYYIIDLKQKELKPLSGYVTVIR